MSQEKIAILVDSASDVPAEYLKEYNMYLLSLKIIYDTKEYLDGVDISHAEVYERLEKEIPTTSLPDFQQIEDTLQKIKDDGYTHVVAITISSNLSGTNNIVKMASDEFEGLVVETIDTKNISMGSGNIAIDAARAVREGLSFDEVVERVKTDVENAQVFFSVQTLKYLKNGGRIGKVAGFLGELLNIKPVIDCNDEGIYETIGKARGWSNAMTEVIKLAKEYADGFRDCNIAFVYGYFDDEIKDAMKTTKLVFKNANDFIVNQISPTVAIHSGPGLVGIGVLGIDKKNKK